MARPNELAWIRWSLRTSAMALDGSAFARRTHSRQGSWTSILLLKPGGIEAKVAESLFCERLAPRRRRDRAGPRPRRVAPRARRHRAPPARGEGGARDARRARRARRAGAAAARGAAVHARHREPREPRAARSQRFREG